MLMKYIPELVEARFPGMEDVEVVTDASGPDHEPIRPLFWFNQIIQAPYF
jgi:hypothetical protein